MSTVPYNNVSNINSNYIEQFQQVDVKEKVFLVKGRTLDRKCPHKGCTLNYDKTKSEFVCPCHHSKFNLDGNCISGPACPSNIRI
jgi:cytochrome b6-f complex iron-sulfur subunit